MRSIRLLRRWGASLALSLMAGLLAGCVDPENGAAGATGGTALYAFDTADAATTRLLIWDSTTAFYDADALPATTRTLTSDQFAKVKNLAWGGLVVDGSGNRLYMVSEAGDVVRVERLRQQSGQIPTTEAFHFTLGNSADHLNNGKFSQAALDPATGNLYVLETTDSEARVWVVPGPSLYPEGATITPGTKISVGGDKAGTGLAAAGGAVFAYFNEGNQVQYSTETFNGARLRKGDANGFGGGLLLIGGSTALGKYGSLAADTDNNRLYCARHNQDAASSAPPISVFTFGQFGSSPNQAPDKGTLGTAALNNIRVIAHPGRKDWLAAIDATSGEAATNLLRLFKNPSQGGAVKTFTLGAGVKLKGVALDGNA